MTLVSSPRKVVIGLCATRILQGCSMRAMVSEVSLMYGIVAVVTGPEFTLVLVSDYVHPDDQTQPTFEMTHGFKPFTVS